MRYEKLLVGIAVLLLTVLADLKPAAAQKGVRFSVELCSAPDGINDAAGRTVSDCASACRIDPSNPVFLSLVRSCDAHIDAASHSASTVGGAAALAGLPWVSVVTDFFVARLKGEASLFLKERIAGQLCPKESDTVVTALLPATCGILRGANIAALPSAFRADVEKLPKSAFDYAISLAGQAMPAQQRDAICIAAALPGPISVLHKRGPYEALNELSKALSPNSDCNEAVEEMSDVATWILAALDVVQAQADGSDRSKVMEKAREATQSIVIGRYSVLQTEPKSSRSAEFGAVDTRITALGKRMEDIRPLISELYLLIVKIKGKAPEKTDFDRAAELTVLIWVTLLETSEDTKSDLLATAKAISALINKRYLEGALSLLSVKALDVVMSKNEKAAEFWKRLGEWGATLAALADAKDAEDAQKILEAAAAPLGSYREFTEGGWKCFISGWAGFGAGRDWMFTEGEDSQNKGASAVGPMLPVGLEIGHAVSDKGTSLQLLFSVIDIGAPAIARFDGQGDAGGEGMDGEVKISSETSWSSVFAPGMFVGLRPRKWPFVIGGGAELLPSAVAKFDCDEGQAICSDTTSTPTMRFMGFVAFDLTAFRIF